MQPEQFTPREEDESHHQIHTSMKSLIYSRNNSPGSHLYVSERNVDGAVVRVRALQSFSFTQISQMYGASFSSSNNKKLPVLILLHSGNLLCSLRLT